MTPLKPHDAEQSWLPYPLLIRIAISEVVDNSLHTDLKLLQVGDFEAVLTGGFAKSFLSDLNQEPALWYLDIRDVIWETTDKQLQLLAAYHTIIVGFALLNAFIQSNVTGPPLSTPFSVGQLFLGEEDRADPAALEELRKKCHQSLVVDGETLYPLLSYIELFCAASLIFNSQFIREVVQDIRWPRIHVNFLHQRMLLDGVSSLQVEIYEDLKGLEKIVFCPESPYPEEIQVRFLLERAAINTFHGFDSKTREDLNRACQLTGFQYALTGLLGKRTKFQQTETSQLVVLATSNDVAAQKKAKKCRQNNGKFVESITDSQQAHKSKPTNLDLNDDTLLESISFSEKSKFLPNAVSDESSLPAALTALDPSNQPMLKPLDSIILLLLASSITNTSPTDGLTREETLPYATRVLDGGSSNWQIYTQALLVRSRIEGYRSRTVERGVLQLQALVDQVIAETTTDAAFNDAKTTFLRKSKPSEAASVTERLQYIHQLCSPTRWELEAELAARWVSLGGLRTALEIYERLQMWAEAALCWAGVEREDKAKKIIRRQLYRSTNDSHPIEDHEEELWKGEVRDPPPPDAPRLYCILGDIDQDPAMYERAWEVSNNRYSRAQRSLGRHYFSVKDYPKAAAAYESSLGINRLNHASWFALGCVRLELQQWDKAVEAFSRTVQLDDQDAEAWSNLAAALLRMETNLPAQAAWPRSTTDDEEDEVLTAPQTEAPGPQRCKRDALTALTRASRLKHTSFRIWENLLIVAASLHPPSYIDITIAQKRIIELRGPSIGEKCIDEDILELLVRHVITTDIESNQPRGGSGNEKRGVERMLVELIDQDVVPLITTSRRLWQLVAKIKLWRNRPKEALDAHEKAWRAIVSQPGWEFGAVERWDEVVDATIELMDAYESLGQMERTEGLAAGGGELVMKDWKFKARSAVRGIMGRGKQSWEGTDGWKRLRVGLGALK